MASHGWLARVQYGWLKRLTGPGLVGYTAHTYCQLTLTVEMGMKGNGNSAGELGGMGIMCKIQNGGNGNGNEPMEMEKNGNTKSHSRPSLL